MPAIHTFPAFDALLAITMEQMSRLVTEYHGDAFLESIQRQLRFVHDWTRGGQRPTDEQLKKLSFGVMAGRAVEDIDPGIAEHLYRLANYLDQWK